MVSDTRLPVLVGAFVLAACSPPAPAPALAPPVPPPAAPAVEASASLTVNARLEGPAPRFAPIIMSKDAYCESARPQPVESELVVAKEGRLANVIAWISGGLPEGLRSAPMSPVLLEMHGCLFRPHVFTVMAGQPVRIENTDPITHCAHSDPRSGRSFNITIHKNRSTTVSIDQAEVAVRIKCDCYGWMECWAGAFDHPYHGVTGEDGSLSLKVPPGSYEVSAWHEYRKFAKQAPRPVTVAAGETKEVEFVFRVP